MILSLVECWGSNPSFSALLLNSPDYEILTKFIFCVATPLLLCVGLVRTELSKTQNYKYRPAKLVENQRTKKIYVEFWAWDEDKGKLKRKRISEGLNDPNITETERQDKIKGLTNYINSQLRKGACFNEAALKRIEISATSDNVEFFMPLSEILPQIIEKRKKLKAKKTNQSYQSIQNDFLRYFDEKRVCDVNPGTVSNYVDDMINRELNPKTINVRITVLKGWFQTLVESEVLEINPFSKFRRLKEHTGTRNEAFTLDQTKELSDYLRAHDEQLWHFSQFMFYLFLRPTEIRELKIKHLHLSEKKISIPASISNKTKRDASLHIPRELFNLICNMKLEGLKGDDYIFRNKTGENLGKGTLYKRFRKILDNFEFVGDYTLYSWKHTGVVTAYKTGTDIVSIQRHCRHADLEATQVYLKSLGFDDNYGITKMDNLQIFE